MRYIKVLTVQYMRGSYHCTSTNVFQYYQNVRIFALKTDVACVIVVVLDGGLFCIQHTIQAEWQNSTSKAFSVWPQACDQVTYKSSRSILSSVHTTEPKLDRRNTAMDFSRS